MQRILLLMPFFMGYQETMKKALLNEYDVDLINSDQFDQVILKRYNGCSKIRWALRHAVKYIDLCDMEAAQETTYTAMLNLADPAFHAYDIVFCINGTYVPNRFYDFIKKKNPNSRFIYYAWDDLANLKKVNHIHFFDELYSYNIEDCKNNNMHYLPVFVQEENIGHETDLYDIAYVASGYSKERIKFAEKLYERYSGKYKLFIYLYDPAMKSGSKFAHEKPLSNKEYLSILRKTKAVIDIPGRRQRGPTTRSFDALLTKTKVITTNTYIKEYPVYSENFLIIDKKKPVIDEQFMRKEYVETDYKSLNIKEWLSAIGL